MMYTSRVSAFSFCLKKKTPAKEKQNRGNPPCTPPGNAVPQYIACGSQSAARHIRAQTHRSLNECALVRLASQAVQPSQNIVAYRPWSGRYAPFFRQHRLALSATGGASVMLPACLCWISNTAARLLEV